jgi:short-subunit dehydrogenase
LHHLLDRKACPSYRHAFCFWEQVDSLDKIVIPGEAKSRWRDEPTRDLYFERQHMKANTTALITGASGGIGYELAKLFAHDHYNLVLVARSADKLTQFADELQRQFSITAKPVPLDLTDGPAPQFLLDQLKRENIPIDVLVNNAAYGILGEFSKVPLEENLGQIQLNITALTHMTRLFLPPMLERGAGRIMNVASTAGFQPGPLMAVYYASKAYVISFSEALANELSGTGVTVTCLCPGPTDTGFQGRAGTENTALFKALPPMDAKTVARDGYRGLVAGKTLVISGLRNRLLMESLRVSPRKLVTAISRKILDQKG